MRYFFLLLFVVSFYGCSPVAYVQSEFDESYSFNSQKSIYIHIPDDASIKQKNFCIYLKKEAERRGFTLSDSYESSDIAVAVVLTEDSRDVPTSLTLPYSNSTYGSVGGVGFNATSTQWVTTNYSTRLDVQRIYLYAYDAHRPIQGNVTIWNGYIGVDQRYYQSNIAGVAKLLFDGYGKQLNKSISYF